MLLFQLGLWLAACHRDEKPVDSAGPADTWGGGGGWETDWVAPDCDAVSGTAALTWTSDGGQTTTPTDETWVADANVSSLLPLSTPGALVALVGGVLYRSADGGCTWAASDTPDAADRALVEGPDGTVWGWSRGLTTLLQVEGDSAALTPDLGFKPFGLGVDAQDGAHLRVGTGGCDIYESTDAGQSWTLLFEAPIDTLSATAVVFDPEDLDHVLCTITREAVWQSTDGGDRWDQGRGLPEGVDLTFNAAVFVPGTDGVWAVATYPGVDVHGALFRSSDGGASWSEVWGGGDEAPVNDEARFAVHPAEPAVLAFTGVDALYTVDARSGAVTASTPSAGRELQALAACPAEPGLWYLGWGTDSYAE